LLFTDGLVERRDEIIDAGFAWLGAAFAAWAAGASRGWFGSYTYAFVSAGALCLLAAGLSLRIGRRESTPAFLPQPATG